MLKNYLVVAWRNLTRNRTLSIINLSGLSISIAFCLLLFYHVRWEQSFDKFHAGRNRIFRIESTTSKENDGDNQMVFPIVSGPQLQRTFPEVEGYNRLQTGGEDLVKVGDNVYQEKQVVSADENFFRMFSFPLLKGDPRTALSSPLNVVLSETVAKKYFGNRDPMGQAIRLADDSTQVFRVTGVAADAPANSSIQYGLVFPVVRLNYAEKEKNAYNSQSNMLLLELRPGVDRYAFEMKLNGWVKNSFIPYVDTIWTFRSKSEWASYRWLMRPLSECHYDSYGGWGHYTNAKVIYQLLSLVVVILLLASLNYVLVTVSNAAARGQEVGVRKVMGAARGAIVLQSWIETLLVVGLAVGIGLLLSGLGMPLLRIAIGSGVTLSAIPAGEVLLAAAALALLLSVIAGYYPALLISRFRPVSILKGFSSFRINPRFSRVLVVVQFTCCVVLMAAALIISRQMNYMMNKDLGFEKEQVLIVHIPSYDWDFIQNTRDKLYAFARSRPDVVAYSSMNGGPMGASNDNGIVIDGRRERYKMIEVDYNYFQLLKIKVLEGRTFSREFGDTVGGIRPVVVNQEMMKLLGPDARVGAFNKAMQATIIGVVKDYNFESLTNKVKPEQHRLSKYASDYLFRLRGGDVHATVSAFETAWKQMTHNYPFSYDFLDASLRTRYEADLRWQHAMESASFFAILIACMGLFGLSAIAMANRTKEIGIRKVLGASVRELSALLASSFLSMVALAIVIAVPLSWWLMNKWLGDFAYRVEIQWWMFGIVGLAAVAIALATISFQVLRAARANPVNALRSE